MASSGIYFAYIEGPAGGTPVTTKAILLAYKDDTLNTVSRDTMKRLAKVLGMTETAAIHYALAKLARETLPAYPKDSGPLMANQIAAIRKAEPQDIVATRSLLPGL